MTNILRFHLFSCFDFLLENQVVKVLTLFSGAAAETQQQKKLSRHMCYTPQSQRERVNSASLLSNSNIWGIPPTYRAYSHVSIRWHHINTTNNSTGIYLLCYQSLAAGGVYRLRKRAISRGDVFFFLCGNFVALSAHTAILRATVKQKSMKSR